VKVGSIYVEVQWQISAFVSMAGGWIVLGIEVGLPLGEMATLLAQRRGIGRLIPCPLDMLICCSLSHPLLSHLHPPSFIRPMHLQFASEGPPKSRNVQTIWEAATDLVHPFQASGSNPTLNSIDPKWHILHCIWRSAVKLGRSKRVPPGIAFERFP
jgi:hypothetical protein